MFHEDPIRGHSSLLAGQLVLTFDDGPGLTGSPGAGPRTAELATYLHAHGVVATFFMCGANVERFPDVPRIVHDLGHVVGNHTYSHPSLPSLPPGRVLDEVRRTRDLLVDYGVATPMPFRAPYGHWGSCASVLNEDADLRDSHVGHYDWDIDRCDWDYWKRSRPVEECLAAYRAEVRTVGRGVILLHDSTADDDQIASRNRTFSLVTELVPRLRDDGFEFVPLSAVDPGGTVPGRGTGTDTVDGPS